MANLFDLQAKISLDSSSYEKGLNDASGKTQSFASKIGGGLANAAKVGAAAIGAATTAVVAFAKDSVGVGMGFDKSMSQVAATMGTTVDQIQDLRDFALEMGSTTAFSAGQAADALNFMALAGYDAETSMQMLPNVLNLAAAGGIDLASASDMVTDASSALGLTLEETSELVDKMAQASSKSNTSVAQLGEAILTVGGTAKNLEGGTTELATALGILADNGIKGAEGGTALRNIILSLSAPTDKAAEMMKDLGLSAYDSQGNLRSLNDIFTDLNGSLSSMTQGKQTEVLNTLFNKVDLKSANALLANTGERFYELSGYIDDASGAAQAMADTQLDNLAGDITLFQSALEGAKIAVSDELTPALRGFVQFGAEGLSKLTSAFQEGGLSGAMEAFGGILSDGLNMIIEGLPEAVEAGSKLLGALVRGIISNIPTLAKAALEIIQQLSSSLIESLPTMISSLSEVILQIGAMISDPATLETLSKAALEIINQLGTGLVESLPAIMSMLTNVVIQIGKMLSDPATLNTLIRTGISLLMALLQGILESLPQLVTAALEIIQNLGNAILDNLPLLIESGISILTQLLDTITENLPMLIEMALSIIMELANGIIQHLPELVDAAIEIINQLVTFLTDNLDMLVDSALEIVLAIVDFLIENVDELVDASIEIIIALADGLITAIPALLDKAPEIIMKLLDALIENAPKLLDSGLELIGKIAEGIENVISKIWDMGKQIVEGLWNGISDTADWLWEKVSGWVGGLVDGIKGFLGIHSPSTVFAEIGEDSAKGYGEGFVETMEDVGKDMQNALNATVEDLQNSGVDWDKYSDRFWMTRGGGFEGLLDELRYNDEKDTLYGELLDYLHYEYDFAYEDAQKIIEAYNSAKDVANLLKEEEIVSSTTKSSTQTSGSGYRGLFGVDNSGGTVTNTITINVHPSEGMDEKKLADIIERKLMAALDRREAAWA